MIVICRAEYQRHVVVRRIVETKSSKHSAVPETTVSCNSFEYPNPYLGWRLLACLPFATPPKFLWAGPFETPKSSMHPLVTPVPVGAGSRGDALPATRDKWLHLKSQLQPP